MQEQARNHFRSVQPDCVSAFFFKAKGEAPTSSFRATCHAPIRSKHPFYTNPDIEVFATNARGDTPENKRYLDWVMSREHSPWRKMFTKDDFEILYNSHGKQVGVLFPESFLKKNKFASIMGFVTALRFPSEPQDRAHTWDFLVTKHKVDPFVALMITTFFIKSIQGGLTPSLINTNHHIVCCTQRIDVQKIKEGNLNWEASSVFDLMPSGNTNIESIYYKSREYREPQQVGALKGTTTNIWSVEEVLKLWRSAYEK